MRDFDYFGESEASASWDDTVEPVSLEARIARYRAQQRRYSRALTLMTATFVICGWFALGLKDDLAYVFSAPRAPRVVGDVAQIHPKDLRHNEYVTVTGITEPNRGLSQKRTRGLSLSRQEYWTFRLIGSRGLFVEAPADKHAYGYGTRVTVTGRIVDPDHSEEYRRLLDHYHEHFFAQRRPENRVLQVGYHPGQGRLPYYLAGVLVLLLTVSNGYALVQLLRYRAMVTRAGRVA